MYVITGGGTGIGRAVALALAARKQRVLVIGRRKRPLKEVASHSPMISYLSADVTTQKGLHAIRDHVHTVPSIHALIHCAAVIAPIAPTRDLNAKDWNRLMNTNLYAPLFLTQMLMDKLKNGKTLHLESNLADMPVKGLTAYCVSKAGLALLVQTWQKDTNSVAMGRVNPGVVNTDLVTYVLEANYVDETMQAILRKASQENLLVSPEVVALFLIWLLLDVDKKRYESKLWTIHDSSHHSEWLKPPHTLPDQSHF